MTGDESCGSFKSKYLVPSIKGLLELKLARSSQPLSPHPTTNAITVMPINTEVRIQFVRISNSPDDFL
jgi:hypothetical protein